MNSGNPNKKPERNGFFQTLKKVPKPLWSIPIGLACGLFALLLGGHIAHFILGTVIGFVISIFALAAKRNPIALQRTIKTEQKYDSTGAPIVYISKRGRVFHHNDWDNCGYGEIEMTLHDALSHGYTPCKKCEWGRFLKHFPQGTSFTNE